MNLEDGYIHSEKGGMNMNEKTWRDGSTPNNDFNSVDSKTTNQASNYTEAIPQMSEEENANRQKWWDSPEFKIGLEKLLAEAGVSDSEDKNSQQDDSDKKDSFIYFPEDLVESYKSQYPYFYSYIKNDFKKYLLGSEKIKQVLLKYSVGMLTPDKINETASFDAKTGPKIQIIQFSNPNQNGEYYYKENTIKLSETLIQQYEAVMSDPNATSNKKSAVSISLNQVLINEFTHYGDALDGIDAIQDTDGTIINNPIEGEEGGMTSKFDEGNEAVGEIFGFYGTEEITGLQNLILHTKGLYLDPNTKNPVGEDKSKIDPSLIPPIPKLDNK